MNYLDNAVNFLKSTGVTFNAEFVENALYFESDNATRDVYSITLKRGNRIYKFKYGQSLANSSHYVKTFNNGKTIKFGLDGYPLQGNIRILDVQRYLDTFPKEENPKLVKGTLPTEYDFLACLQKYEVGTFEDFCNEFGYDTDSRSAKKTYKAVKKEFGKVCKIWTDEEIEALQEIQ